MFQIGFFRTIRLFTGMLPENPVDAELQIEQCRKELAGKQSYMEVPNGNSYNFPRKNVSLWLEEVSLWLKELGIRI